MSAGKKIGVRARFTERGAKVNRALTPIFCRIQQGFTYVGILIAVAAMGGGLASVGELASHAQQREKEVELLFVGGEFRRAIANYYERTPGAVKRYPQTLEALLEDKRFPMAQRHLRRIYPDPITGKGAWGLIEAPGGGIMGVYSLSEAAPIKTAGFALADIELNGAAKYTDWKFYYSPQPLIPPRQASGQPPRPAQKS